MAAIDAGDPKAADELLPLIYNELRKLDAVRLAREKPGQTLEATALVHEAYQRLVDLKQSRHWNTRAGWPQRITPRRPPGPELLRGGSRTPKPGPEPKQTRFASLKLMLDRCR